MSTKIFVEVVTMIWDSLFPLRALILTWYSRIGPVVSSLSGGFQDMFSDRGDKAVAIKDCTVSGAVCNKKITDPLLYHIHWVFST